MTLRRALGDDARRIHELVDKLLDSEDCLIVLIDGERAITFGEGFGVSPCQLELMTVEIARAVRSVGGTGTAGFKRKAGQRRSGKVDGLAGQHPSAA